MNAEDFIHVDTADTIDESAGADPTHPLNKKARKTRYEIQLAVSAADENLWKPVGVVEASSARVAIRELIEKGDLATGKMRAIPVRNITQVVVTFETHKQLTLT